ncbi:hypothetical protein Shyhy01_32200 [Streptomyces hygroscopicus subsp. hygroscopicus]|nr:hypothetical protein Shyhy01_32200 [Streptomyces hygroscopicus subsp. hygroscopicus]
MPGRASSQGGTIGGDIAAVGYGGTHRRAGTGVTPRAQDSGKPVRPDEAPALRDEPGGAGPGPSAAQYSPITASAGKRPPRVRAAVTGTREGRPPYGRWSPRGRARGRCWCGAPPVSATPASAARRTARGAGPDGVRHEGAGVVKAVGAEVTGVAPDNRVR